MRSWDLLDGEMSMKDKQTRGSRSTEVESGAVSRHGLEGRLERSGMRMTPQREHVFTIVSEQLDHPTAEQVFMKAKELMPEISMATVYNCLEKFVECELIRLVQLDRGATRYCPNMHDHSHYYCEACGDVFDVDFDREKLRLVLDLPQGALPMGYEVAVRGLCPGCRNGEKSQALSKAGDADNSTRILS